VVLTVAAVRGTGAEQVQLRQRHEKNDDGDEDDRPERAVFRRRAKVRRLVPRSIALLASSISASPAASVPHP